MHTERNQRLHFLSPPFPDIKVFFRALFSFRSKISHTVCLVHVCLVRSLLLSAQVLNQYLLVSPSGVQIVFVCGRASVPTSSWISYGLWGDHCM